MSVKILYLVTLLDSLGMALTLPLISVNILALGGSLSVAGILQSLTAGAQLFASPVVGSWSDTRGRKLLLLSTLSLIFVSNALSGIPSLLFFFIGRILYGIAHQTDPLIKALISDTLPQHQQNGAFNKLMATMISAFLVAPVLGGIFYQHFKSFTYISLILCSLDIVTLSIVFMFLQEPVKQTKGEAEKSKKNDDTFLQSLSKDLAKVFSGLKNVEWSRYGDLLAIKFIQESSFNMLFMNMGVVLMNKFLFTQTQMGMSISFLSLNMIVSTLLSGYAIKKLYESDKSGFKRILHGFTSLFIFFCLLPFTSTWPLYLSTFLPLCLAKSLLDTTWMEVLSNRTTEADKGVMMGAATSMLSLAGLVCPLINGLTGDFVGIEALLALPIIPSFCGLVLINKVQHRLSISPQKHD